MPVQDCRCGGSQNYPPDYLYGKLDQYRGVGIRHSDNVRLGEVAWPADARSAIIIAVEHSADKPELNWWRDGYSGGTTGNRIFLSVLETIVRSGVLLINPLELVQWNIRKTY